MTVTQEAYAALQAAKLESRQATAEYIAGETSYEYANAAQNAWDAKLEDWAERMGV